MTAERYEKLTGRLRKYPGAAVWMERGSKGLTGITYVAYLLLVIAEGLSDPAVFLRVLLIPASGFAAVTIFRKKFNAKRPYEILDIDPLLKRKKKGESFPSRHAFSIFMIAMALGYVSRAAGMVFLVLGVLMAWIRVVGGVHFPRDVIAGAAVGIGWGLVGFYLISGTV